MRQISPPVDGLVTPTYSLPWKIGPGSWGSKPEIPVLFGSPRPALTTCRKVSPSSDTQICAPVLVLETGTIRSVLENEGVR